MATRNDVEIRVVDDPAREAADLLIAAAGHVALSGGSAPGPAYELAARLRPDWSGAHVWFGDDRAVPPDDELSNYRLAKETLLDRLTAPPEVHRILGELGAEKAADLYDEELEGVTLDLALNGIGPDGHTASLFPGAATLEEKERRAVAAEGKLEPFVARVTMTPPVFAEAELLVYLVLGADKAEVVRRAFADDPSPEIPASLIRGRRTIAILDSGAASLLPQG
ncbi:MAG: 6-phosphogluconolactonase [Gaiellaceae bacterium]|nr:6-phosphogluconolactonase [Gaiellaceae bacterium]